MRKIAIKLINWYQSVSKHKNPTCRYRPTCSAYAKEAYKTRNFFVATWLSFYRIIRCNPFSKGGYDPVPKKKTPLNHFHNIHYLHIPLKDKNANNVTLNTYLKRPLIVHFMPSHVNKDSLSTKKLLLAHRDAFESAGLTLILVHEHTINECFSDELFHHIQCVKDTSHELAKAFAVYDPEKTCVKLSTFLINEYGQISQQFLETSEERHVEEVIKAMPK